MENMIQVSLGIPMHVHQKEIIAGFWNDDFSNDSIEVNLINVLLSICRYHVCKIRNTVKYGKKQITDMQNLKLLRFDLETHLNLLILSESVSAKSKDIIHDILKYIEMKI